MDMHGADAGDLIIVREGGAGVIRLNRPKAINALTQDMVEGIAAALADFVADPAVHLVLFEGEGDRGFCAGGDVRAMRSLVLEDEIEAAGDYLAAEYRMNAALAHCPKPTVVLAHGVVMGGGIGIAGHCQFRFAVPGAQFAMPESAIGFLPDVGANFILAQAPRHRSLAFLMSGVPVGLADALALGLCDCRIGDGRRALVRQAIIAAASAPDPARALSHLVAAETTEAGPPALMLAADALLDLDWSNPAIAAAALAATAGFEVTARRSPTSLVATLLVQLAARRLGTIDAVLALEWRVGHWLVTQPDFVEGVRAVLIDKDHAPRWSPLHIDQVDRTTIDRIVSTP